MSKSTRESVSLTEAPVIGNGQITVSKWQAECMRISFSRRSQSMTSFSVSPISGTGPSGAGIWMISSLLSPVMVPAMAISDPSARTSLPVSPGWPPEVA